MLRSQVLLTFDLDWPNFVFRQLLETKWYYFFMAFFWSQKKHISLPPAVQNVLIEQKLKYCTTWVIQHVRNELLPGLIFPVPAGPTVFFLRIHLYQSYYTHKKSKSSQKSLALIVDLSQDFGPCNDFYFWQDHGCQVL